MGTTTCFRWCAYNTEFLLNRDKIFKSWARKGFIASLIYTQASTAKFSSLHDTHGLQQNYFFRYLQVHYFNQKCRPTDLSTAESDFYKILPSVQHQMSPYLDCTMLSFMIISTLYVRKSRKGAF